VIKGREYKVSGQIKGCLIARWVHGEYHIGLDVDGTDCMLKT
jgi:hypothetical protein